MATRGVKPVARPAPSGRPRNSTVTNVASQAGLKNPTIYGPESGAQYISETSSGGVAVLDYDNDGWPDIFIASGTRFGENPPEATNRLYRNQHDGTFADVTAKAGLTRSGWGQGVAVADFDDDGKVRPVCDLLGRECFVPEQWRPNFSRRDGQIRAHAKAVGKGTADPLFAYGYGLKY